MCEQISMEAIQRDAISVSLHAQQSFTRISGVTALVTGGVEHRKQRYFHLRLHLVLYGSNIKRHVRTVSSRVHLRVVTSSDERLRRACARNSQLQPRVGGREGADTSGGRRRQRAWDERNGLDGYSTNVTTFTRVG